MNGCPICDAIAANLTIAEAFAFGLDIGEAFGSEGATICQSHRDEYEQLQEALMSKIKSQKEEIS